MIYEGFCGFRKLILKSPNNIKLDNSDTSTYKHRELSRVSKIEMGAIWGVVKKT